MTFTVIARDPATGDLGIATTTHAFGVGPVADHTRPGVGVVATQSFVEVSYGPQGLDLIEAGVPVQEALEKLLAVDEAREIRQVALMDAAGNVAHFTGRQCVPSCGAVVGDGAIAIGNMLATDDVLPSTLAAVTGDGDFAERLLGALDAGQAAGGDARGTMSAALRIISAERPAGSWLGTSLDLRVDFAVDPLAGLRRDLAVKRAYDIFFGAVFAPGLVTGSDAVTGDELEAALAALAGAQRTLGADREATLWQAVLLLRADRRADGIALAADVLRTRPAFARFVDGLHEIGTIDLGSDEILREATR
ncbi:DUF1028 domain-containing protein [Nakamurella sp. YIM 132087]|uniref:DUF1028 domain-containing protein n=1 Tax=Nakamurella alba TaxID=2665158 RepID=A0A7K1FMT5_9ACTN|nr:DUF1028 domain-containing protein [Nakamurella alba]MTD15481.1 DUF1028 domain-containing protein [Nakamurella alba]